VSSSRKYVTVDDLEKVLVKLAETLKAHAIEALGGLTAVPSRMERPANRAGRSPEEVASMLEAMKLGHSMTRQVHEGGRDRVGVAHQDADGERQIRGDKQSALASCDLVDVVGSGKIVEHPDDVPDRDVVIQDQVVIDPAIVEFGVEHGDFLSVDAEGAGYTSPLGTTVEDGLDVGETPFGEPAFDSAVGGGSAGLGAAPAAEIPSERVGFEPGVLYSGGDISWVTLHFAGPRERKDDWMRAIFDAAQRLNLLAYKPEGEAGPGWSPSSIRIDHEAAGNV